MKRTLSALAVGTAAFIATALPAAAHTEFQPSSATVGSKTAFNLFVEDEQSAAGTTKVELTFPSALTVASAEAPTGWKVEAVGGSVGSTATGLTWSGPALADSANLKLELGPLPADKTRLQFKVVQTYDNGTIDRWIGTNPVGGPEPENPGPVIDLVAEGETPTTGADSGHDHAGGDHDVTTTAAEHGHEAGSHDATTTAATTAAKSDSSDDSNTGAIVGIIAAVVVLGGGLAFAISSRKKGAKDSDTKPTA